MGLRAIQGIGLGKRMDAGRVEGFIAVDVSETRDGALIKQQGFDLSGSAEQFDKCGEVQVQGFGAEFAEPATNVSLTSS